MTKLILIYDDGRMTTLGPHESIGVVLAMLKNSNIKTIVAGQVEYDKVIWEKQFNAITVMPKEFGA